MIFEHVFFEWSVFASELFKLWHERHFYSNAEHMTEQYKYYRQKYNYNVQNITWVRSDEIKELLCWMFLIVTLQFSVCADAPKEQYKKKKQLMWSPKVLEECWEYSYDGGWRFGGTVEYGSWSMAWIIRSSVLMYHSLMPHCEEESLNRL